MSVEGRTGPFVRTNLLRRVVRTGFRLTVFVFAIIGIAMAGLELHSWYVGTRWRPEDINALIAVESPARSLAGRAWDEFKFLLQYGTLFIGAVAFATALTKARTISRIISDFIVARGPIYSLGTTITEVDRTVSMLSEQVARLSRLEPTIREISEKIEETFAQIANLQRLTISERSEATSENAVNQGADQRIQTQPIEITEEEDRNWERIRELWNNNGERLDSVIERISDKRRRGKFQRMPRTNYPAIINALGDESYISDAARNASLKLHSIFMSYKPRNRKIPDEAVASMELLDRMLEHELCPPPEETLPPSSSTVDSPALTSV